MSEDTITQRDNMTEPYQDFKLLLRHGPRRLDRDDPLAPAVLSRGVVHYIREIPPDGQYHGSSKRTHGQYRGVTIRH